MATSKQVVSILDDVLAMAGTARRHAVALRAGGQLLSTQGRPEALPSDQIALLLLSILIGTPTGDGHAVLVSTYAAMRTGTGGPTLAAVLTSFVDDPHGLFELRVDMNGPGASVTVRQPDNGMATLAFHSDWRCDRPAFDRLAIMDGGLLVRLVAAIRNAPVIRAGRRRRHARFSN